MPTEPVAPHSMSTPGILPRIAQLKEQGKCGETEDTEEAKMASRIRQLEDQLSSTEAELNETKALLKGAISEQPELVRTDELAPYRRGMSYYGARPVVNLHGFGNTGRVVDIWKYLMDDIDYLSVYFFPDQISWESLTPAIQEKLVAWAPKSRQYLESAPRRRSHVIFEAWIWHILYENIFSKAEGPWLGEHWEAYSMLRRLGARKPTLIDLSFLHSSSPYTLSFARWRR